VWCGPACLFVSPRFGEPVVSGGDQPSLGHLPEGDQILDAADAVESKLQKTNAFVTASSRVLVLERGERVPAAFPRFF